MSEPSHFISVVKYWLDGPCCLLVSVFGIVFNTAAMMLLARQRVQRIFHMLMLFLSLWDALYLLFSIICFSLPVLSVHYRDRIFVYLLPYAIPLAQMCLFGSCYSTVALTIERYIAVCVPFFRLRHNIKARLYVLPILVMAPLYNVPRFFEFRAKSGVVHACEHFWTGDAGDANATAEEESGVSSSLYATVSFNETQFSNLSADDLARCRPPGVWTQKDAVDLIVTDFRKNPTYIKVYVNIFNWLVNLIIPTALLCILNCLIYRALRRNKSLGQQLRRNGGGKEEALRKRDVRLTRIAIVIVGVFIFCHLPRFVPNSVELFTDSLPRSFEVVVSFNNLLQTLNCSVNLLIYYGHCYWKKSDKRYNCELVDSRNSRNNTSRLGVGPITSSSNAASSSIVTSATNVVGGGTTTVVQHGLLRQLVSVDEDGSAVLSS